LQSTIDLKQRPADHNHITPFNKKSCTQGRCSAQFLRMMYHIYIMQTTTLARTQIYLTQTQQKRLAAACRRTAVTKSELIRQAVDQFLDQQTTAPRSDKLARVQGIAGLWADRSDLADPTAYVRTLRAPRF
jgi:hypothetical protein